MKAIIICPNQASGIPVLADSKPLVTLPFLGESFISHWLKHLASERIKEVRIVTDDSARSIAEAAGLGSRWGLKVEIFHEVRELSVAEARKRYRPAYETDWPAEPLDVIVADHFPGVPGHKVFESYASWFKALGLWVPQADASKRLGTREIEPGVWAGRRCKIAKSAKLVAPCWIGDGVQVGGSSTIGGMAFLENHVVIDERSVVRNSWVGPDTYVGSLTELNESLAWGSLLINWRTASHTVIPDPFLMAPLANRPGGPEREGNAVQEKKRSLIKPFEAVISFAQKLQG